MSLEPGVGVAEIGDLVKKKIKLKDGISIIIQPNITHYIKNISKK